MGFMGLGDFLSIHPTELKFLIELRKQSSCSMQLINKTDQYIAFKVKTTNPRKYSVRPNAAVILPGSLCNVIVTMQAPKEVPPEMQCKDKFLIQSVVMPDGATLKDINEQTFNKEDGNVIGEFRLRVAYVAANPPSPVPEEPEDDSSSPSSSFVDDEAEAETSSFSGGKMCQVAMSFEEPTVRSSSSEAWSMISKLMDEKSLAIQQNQKLHQDLDMMRKQIHENSAGRFSIRFVAFVGVLGILFGFFIKMK